MKKVQRSHDTKQNSHFHVSPSVTVLVSGWSAILTPLGLHTSGKLISHLHYNPSNTKCYCYFLKYCSKVIVNNPKHHNVLGTLQIMSQFKMYMQNITFKVIFGTTQNCKRRLTFHNQKKTF